MYNLFKSKRLSCFLVFLFVCSLILLNNIENVHALSVIQTNDTSSSIPVGYHFAPRYISGKTVVTLCSAPSGYKWVAKTGTGYYQLQTTAGKANMPSTSNKGKLWVKYTNVGFYNGTWLDMKITVTDWNSSCRRVEFGRTYIGFGNVSGDDGGKSGWMNVKIEYYKSGTSTLYSGLKGHQPVGDLDYWSDAKESEWIKTGTNSSTKIIIPKDQYSHFNLSGISSHLIGVNSTGGGGTSNNDGSSFIYLYENPSHTITWYGGFLRMNLSCPISEFQINYMANGGVGYMAPTIVKYGVSTALSKNAFTKTGYIFSGWHAYREYDDCWYTNNKWGSKPSSDSKYTHYKDQEKVARTAPCGNVYMYACWKPKTYSIIYDGNGGITASNTSRYSENIVYDSSYTVIQNTFTKEGYIFDGWNTNKDGTGTDWKEGDTFKWSYTNNITLYAQWKSAGPVLETKENYYFKDSIVSVEEVLKNAEANDIIDGNITDNITIDYFEYEDGTKISHPSELDTSKVSKVLVKYVVLNSDGLKDEEINYVYILDKEASIVESTCSIYPRFVNNQVLDDGRHSLNTLYNQSIWLKTEYYDTLISSLNNIESLSQYRYVNEQSYINLLKEN